MCIAWVAACNVKDKERPSCRGFGFDFNNWGQGDWSPCGFDSGHPWPSPFGRTCGASKTAILPFCGRSPRFWFDFNNWGQGDWSPCGFDSGHPWPSPFGRTCGASKTAILPFCGRSPRFCLCAFFTKAPLFAPPSKKGAQTRIKQSPVFVPASFGMPCRAFFAQQGIRFAIRRNGSPISGHFLMKRYKTSPGFVENVQ